MSSTAGILASAAISSGSSFVPAKIIPAHVLRNAHQQADDVANVGPVPYLGPRPSEIERPFLALQPRADVPEKLLAKVRTVDREQSHDGAAKAEALGIAPAQ